MLQQKLKDTPDMHYNQKISDAPSNQDDLQILQQKLEDQSGKLKALEQYASSLRLLRAKQTEQHAKLEDKIKTLEQAYAAASKEAVERQAQLEMSSGNNHESKYAELQSAYDAVQKELKNKGLEIEALVEKNALSTDKTDPLDTKQNSQTQLTSPERDELQAELNKIRAQATADIKVMREQMQQSTDDTVRLLSELEQEKRKITELELMTHPLSLTADDEQQPPVLTHRPATALPEQHDTDEDTEKPPAGLMAADGLVATLMISALCAMVLTLVFLFATESGRDFLSHRLEIRQEQANKADDHSQLP